MAIEVKVGDVVEVSYSATIESIITEKEGVFYWIKRKLKGDSFPRYEKISAQDVIPMPEPSDIEDEAEADEDDMMWQNEEHDVVAPDGSV